MIGQSSVFVRILPRTADRADAIARILGPGDTDYQLPVSITGTVQAIWGIPEEDLEAVIGELVGQIMSILGTASAPPSKGLWFDSYNSEPTIKGTLDRMRNLGVVAYLRDSSSEQISNIFGGGILSEIERISSVVLAKYGLPLVGPLDYAFERSQAERDLATPPADNPGLLYRICILSVIIDALKLRCPTESKDTKSLKALTNFLASQSSEPRARTLTEAFARVKDLRKQYPIHEHFAPDINGQKKIRDEVERAAAFFGFSDLDDSTTRWQKITSVFKAALSAIESALTGDA